MIQQLRVIQCSSENWPIKREETTWLATETDFWGRANRTYKMVKFRNEVISEQIK